MLLPACCGLPAPPVRCPGARPTPGVGVQLNSRRNDRSRAGGRWPLPHEAGPLPLPSAWRGDGGLGGEHVRVEPGSKGWTRSGQGEGECASDVAVRPSATRCESALRLTSPLAGGCGRAGGPRCYAHGAVLLRAGPADGERAGRQDGLAHQTLHRSEQQRQRRRPRGGPSAGRGADDGPAPGRDQGSAWYDRGTGAHERQNSDSRQPSFSNILGCL